MSVELELTPILQVTYLLLVFTKAYRTKVLDWAKESLALMPAAALTEAESRRFLDALSTALVDLDLAKLTETVDEISEICRRNRMVQELIQKALRPLDLSRNESTP